MSDLRISYADNGPLWKVETMDGAISLLVTTRRTCSLCTDARMDTIRLATITEVFENGWDDYYKRTPVVICLPCCDRIGAVVQSARELLAREGVTA